MKVDTSLNTDLQNEFEVLFKMANFLVCSRNSLLAQHLSLRFALPVGCFGIFTASISFLFALIQFSFYVFDNQCVSHRLSF